MTAKGMVCENMCRDTLRNKKRGWNKLTLSRIPPLNMIGSKPCSFMQTGACPKSNVGEIQNLK